MSEVIVMSLFCMIAVFEAVSYRNHWIDSEHRRLLSEDKLESLVVKMSKIKPCGTCHTDGTKSVSGYPHPCCSCGGAGYVKKSGGALC